MTDIEHCRAGVDAIGHDAPVELIVEVVCRLDGMLARIKELRAELDARLVERIKATGEFSIGDVRYYVGTPRTTKCRDVRATAETVLERTGGDLGRLCDCLASDAMKPGETRKVLEEAGAGDAFDKLFAVTFPDKLMQGKLQKADKRFVK